MLEKRQTSAPHTLCHGSRPNWPKRRQSQAILCFGTHRTSGSWRCPQSGAKIVLEQFSPWELYPYSANSTTALLPTSQFQGGLGRHNAMQRILSRIRLFCIFLSVCLIHTANLYLFLAKDWSCYLFFNCKLYAWDKRKKDRRTHSQRREEFKPAKPCAPCGCLTLLDF